MSARSPTGAARTPRPSASGSPTTGIAPDLTLCSTAARTRETWKLAVHELPHRPKTVYEERLYEASLGELIALLNEVPDDINDLLVIGHNPGVHALADALAGGCRGRRAGRG